MHNAFKLWLKIHATQSDDMWPWPTPATQQLVLTTPPPRKKKAIAILGKLPGKSAELAPMLPRCMAPMPHEHKKTRPKSTMRRLQQSDSENGVTLPLLIVGIDGDDGNMLIISSLHDDSVQFLGEWLWWWCRYWGLGPWASPPGFSHEHGKAPLQHNATLLAKSRPWQGEAWQMTLLAR